MKYNIKLVNINQKIIRVKFTDGFCSRSAKSINNRVQFPLNSKLIKLLLIKESY